MLHHYRKFHLSAVFSFAYLLSLQNTYAEVPVIACPNYFRYFSDGSSFFGKITLPNISEGQTMLEVHLSQSGEVPKSNPSSLSLYESEQETSSNFLSGKPITYRVDFPVPNVLPKLTLISINNAILCSDQDYPAPSSKIKLMHDLTLKIKSSITPFVIRESGSNAEKANSFERIEKPCSASYNTNRRFVGNPFLPQTAKPNPSSTQRTVLKNNNFNTKPTFTSNPFLPNVSNKQPPPIIPPTRVANTNSETNTKYSNNPFLMKNPSVKPPTVDENISRLNEVCGRESSAMTPFIRGGTAVKRGEFPWLTAIYRKKGADLKFICAGSLISAKTVISAAHCFVEHKLKAERTLVLLGRNNLELVEEEGSEHRSLQSLVLHPEYTANAISDADIALLHLNMPVTFTRYITPICLWNTATDPNNVAGSTGYVPGWGADSNGDLVIEQPKKIETLIAEDDECKRSLQEYQTLVSTRTICVSTKNNDGPCTGDSGGGLGVYTGGRWALRGIVSAGLTRHGKCYSHEYYYFCDVAKHMDFIQKNLLV